MSLKIDYESRGFGPGVSIPDGSGELDTSWNELLRAALTVGRPNRQYVFRHGTPSLYEALFRLSLVRMALEQTGPRGRRLHRTQAARTLDPSEKGAVNYFLGLAVAKLFAEKLLSAPWMLHLDVFRPQLNPVLRGRSRPDLLGQTTGGDWISLECKGRISKPSDRAKQSAKEQAERVTSVNGALPALSVGAITYFARDTLRFYWEDPEPNRKAKKPIEIEVEEDVWRAYYNPIIDFLRSDLMALPQMRDNASLVRFESADISIGVFPPVLDAIMGSRWEEVRQPREINDPRYGRDGIAIVAGETWLERFDKLDSEEF